ncbi:MAG: hypothetical protein EOM22_12870, partial [Gammaproteobacteria bacterium]|nr:hypothetical protein [Gammaproteobacteria bacterium]
MSTSMTIASLGTGMSILAERPVQIPIGGTIRSGIMVLTRDFANNERAKEIYAEGLDAGVAFKAINDKIKRELNLQKNPMTPKNAPYFTVRPGDFSMPEIADRIMELYGEDGEHGFQLYRFPVIFPVDQWLAVLPHEFACYSANERRYWSEYGPDGTRYCKTHAQVEMDPKNRRARKVFGGRRVVLRDDNQGVCQPNTCDEYQRGECALAGRFVFYVPGVPGTKAIQLPTRSIYSLQAARQQLELVAYVRGGRISGKHNGEPIFWIAKKQDEVSMIDPATGKPKRVKQFLISLEANIDMTAMMDIADRDDTDDLPRLAQPEDTDVIEQAAPAVVEQSSPAPDLQSLKPLRQSVIAQIERHKIARDDWRVYASREYGPDWW